MFLIASFVKHLVSATAEIHRKSSLEHCFIDASRVLLSVLLGMSACPCLCAELCGDGRIALDPRSALDLGYGSLEASMQTHSLGCD